MHYLRIHHIQISNEHCLTAATIFTLIIKYVYINGCLMNTITYIKGYDTCSMVNTHLKQILPVPAGGAVQTKSTKVFSSLLI